MLKNRPRYDSALRILSRTPSLRSGFQLVGCLARGDRISIRRESPGAGAKPKVIRMREPKGEIVESTSIGSLNPVEVLFEFDCEYLTFLAHEPPADSKNAWLIVDRMNGY
jgi:hypothetical protein